MTPWFSGISGRQRREYESDLRGNEHYLSRSENKAGKKHLFFYSSSAVQIYDFHIFTVVY